MNVNLKIEELADNIQRRPGRYRLRVENVTSYIPVPMAWTSRGWGVFVNTTFVPVFDVGAEDPDALTVTAEEGEVDFYVFTGDSPRALLDAYTSLTGAPRSCPSGATASHSSATRRSTSTGCWARQWPFATIGSRAT